MLWFSGSLVDIMARFLWWFLDKVKTAFILEEKLDIYNQSMDSNKKKNSTFEILCKSLGSHLPFSGFIYSGNAEMRKRRTNLLLFLTNFACWWISQRESKIFSIHKKGASFLPHESYGNPLPFITLRCNKVTCKQFFLIQSMYLS